MEETRIDEIANKIITHPSYGKKNPIDIGIEYGYSKTELEEFISCLKEKKNELDPKYGYFVLYGRLYLIDLKSFKQKKIKDVTYSYKIKRDIFVEYNEKTVNWSFANSGRRGTKILDCNISKVFILNSGILVIDENKDTFLIYWNGSISHKIKIDENSAIVSLVFEDKNGIYLYKTGLDGLNDEIEKINFKFDRIDTILPLEKDFCVGAIGVKNEELYYYMDKKYCVNAMTGEKILCEWENENQIEIHGAREMIVLDDYIICEYGVIKQKKKISKEILGYFIKEEREISLGNLNMLHGNIEPIMVLPSKNCIIGVCSFGIWKGIIKIDFEQNSCTVIKGNQVKINITLS